MRQSKKNRFTRRSALVLVLALLCTGLAASPAGADATYVVVSGDTLSGIAEDHGISLQELLDANNLDVNDIIYVGQQLTIPGVEEYVTSYGDLVVEGRGWGHGRGMGQYGSLGYAIDEGWTRDQILEHFYGNTTASVLDPQEMTVRLRGHDGSSTKVYVEDAILVVGDENGNWIELDDQAVKITLDGNLDRYSISVGSNCGSSFTDTGINITSPIVRVRSAHYAPPVSGNALETPPPENSNAGFAITETGGSTTVDETGTTDTFTVVLNSQPTSNVVLTVTSGDTDEVTTTSPLTFTSGNWNTPQTITLTGVQDNSDDGVQTIPVVLSIDDANSDDAFDDLADQTVSVTVTEPVLTVLNTDDADLDVTLQLCEGSNTATWYRGELRAARYEGNQRTVNALPLEQYLRSVVPREMPASWADEGGGSGAIALQVQAVAARSYSLAESRYTYAKTCDTTSCQVYEGRESRSGGSQWSNEDSRSDTAIAATAGLVRMWGDQVARTEFSASTGGHTITVDFPGVPDDGDDVAINPVHRWTEALSLADVLAAYNINDLYEAVVVSRDGFGDDGGRVEDLELRTRSGQVVTVSGYDFQWEFGLKSKWYTIEYGPPNASTSFPEERYDEYRVTSGYTTEELEGLQMAADYFETSTAEIQSIAVGMVAFLLALAGDGTEVNPIENPPEVNGEHAVKSAFFASDGSQGALESVASTFQMNGAQSQKFSSYVLVFLVALAQAQ
ncbi:MAG: hypothetical protein CL420_07785 [Acidimicrobiaceae bacterium]|jgi:peptidoglycan hydrolase-like amidase|nr:hypothetical protein [Acidimicrobiaceae bacterium]|tara:strand:+ start:205 stop:2400 length:2196 start_codon:yes stop_codon:yes gene_type:complete